jgi:hypothetical protein
MSNETSPFQFHGADGVPITGYRMRAASVKDVTHDFYPGGGTRC